MVRHSIVDVANRVANLEERFDHMDTQVQGMRKTQIEIVDNTSEILSMMTAAKKTGRIVRRFAWPVISAAATAGFFNPKVSAFLTALFA